MKKNNHLKTYIKIIVSLAILIFVLNKVNFRQIYNIIISADYAYFLLGASFVILGLAVSALRWQIVLRGYSINMRYHILFILYWSSSFLNLFLPTSFGGDVYKYYHLNKTYAENKRGQIVASILLDRGIGLYTSIIVGLLALSVIETSLSIYIRLVLSCSAIVLVLISIFWQCGVFSKASLGNQNKPKNMVVKTLRIFLEYRNPKGVLYAMLISAFFSALCSLTIYLSFYAVHNDLNFGVFLYTVPALNITKLFPFTIDSIGIKEGVGVYIYSFYNIAPEATLAALLFSRTFNVVVSLMGGLIYIIDRASPYNSKFLEHKG